MTNPKSLPDAVERVRLAAKPHPADHPLTKVGVDPDDLTAVLSQLDKLETENERLMREADGEFVEAAVRIMQAHPGFEARNYTHDGITADDFEALLSEDMAEAWLITEGERAARKSAEASNASLVGALRACDCLLEAMERDDSSCAVPGWYAHIAEHREAIRQALSTLESGEAAADNNRKGAESEGARDYQAMAFADLRTVLGRIDDEFPNYGDYSVALPCGHWREIRAALSPSRSPVGGEAEPVGWQRRLSQAVADRADAISVANGREPLGRRWVYALSPTKEDAERESYGGFEGRPLNEVRPLYASRAPVQGDVVGLPEDLRGPYHTDEMGTFNASGWGFTVQLPDAYWGMGDDLPEEVRSKAELLERAIRSALAAPPSPGQLSRNPGELEASTPSKARDIRSVLDRTGLPNALTPGHPDAYLNALLDYTGGFYAAARACGMEAGPAADAMQHVERAARGLHALATPSKADVGALVEACKPFAAVADEYDDRENDSHEVWADVSEGVVRRSSRLGNYRRLRAVLAFFTASHDGGL